MPFQKLVNKKLAPDPNRPKPIDYEQLRVENEAAATRVANKRAMQSHLKPFIVGGPKFLAELDKRMERQRQSAARAHDEQRWRRLVEQDKGRRMLVTRDEHERIMDMLVRAEPLLELF